MELPPWSSVVVGKSAGLRYWIWCEVAVVPCRQGRMLSQGWVSLRLFTGDAAFLGVGHLGDPSLLWSV